MVLYLGDKKVKLNLNGSIWRLNIFSQKPAIEYNGIISSDNYILTDCNGVYLKIKENE